MTTSRLLSFTALLLALMMPATAFAQSKQDVEKAQEHFKKGAAHYAAGEYPQAVVEFLSGHRLAPNAMFLYNVSLSYERLGRHQDALEAATKAKDYEGMPPKVVNRNEARIAALSVVLSAKDTAEDVKEEQERVADTQDGKGKGDGTGEPETITRPDGITALGWVGVGLAAVGGGFAIAGFSVNESINEDLTAYQNAAAVRDEDRFNELKSDLSARQQRGKVFYAIGAGAASVGVVLFVIDIFAGKETVPVTTRVQPTAGGAAVSASFRF